MRLTTLTTNLLVSLIILSASTSLSNATSFPILDLENKVLTLELTPAVGGRISHFSLKNHRNLIKVGKPFKQSILPTISPFADNIGYLGHTTWVGPQSQWWQQQTINSKRFNSKANWPPDPYTIFSTNTLIKQSQNQIVMQGIKSPITGLRLDKEVSLSERNDNQVKVKAVATNVTKSLRSWDLWFNTRVHADTYIIASVDNKELVNIDSFEQDKVGAISVNYISKGMNDFYVELDVKKLARDKPSNQGKIFIQPNQGWLAGFNSGQLFIITFPWQTHDKIHPEHGQIELYIDYQSKNISESLIEMELHGPYQQIQPEQQISLTATWYLFPYNEHWHKKQMLNFLQEKLNEITSI